jgi:hypothetical protein
MYSEFLVVISHGKHPFGKQRRRWEDNIEMNREVDAQAWNLVQWHSLSVLVCSAFGTC